MLSKTKASSVEDGNLLDWEPTIDSFESLFGDYEEHLPG